MALLIKSILLIKSPILLKKSVCLLWGRIQLLNHDIFYNKNEMLMLVNSIEAFTVGLNALCFLFFHFGKSLINGSKTLFGGFFHKP